MKNLVKRFFFGRGTILSILAIAGISLGSGFLLIQANTRLGAVFNDHIMASNMEGALSATLGAVSLFLLVFLLRICTEYMRQRLWWQGEARLKDYFVKKLLRTESKYFHQRQAPDIWATINLSSQGAASFFAGITATAVSAILLVFYGVLIFRIDVYAGLLSCLAVPFYILLARATGKKVTTLQGGIMDLFRDLGVKAQESISIVQNIKAKNAYDFFSGRIMGTQNKISKTMVKTNTLMTYTGSVSGVISIIAPVLILFGAMHLSPHLSINAGTILILYINIPLFMAAFGSIFASVLSYRASLPALGKLIDLDNVPQEKSDTIELLAFQSLSTHNLSVAFGDSKVIKIPDMAIHKGEKIMIFGESGAGKSTLFNVVMGFNQDYEGAVKVNGIDIREFTVTSLREVFGIAFQHMPVPTLPLKENTTLGQSHLEDAVVSAFHAANLTTLYQEKGNNILRDQTISGGERSRISLAQALVRDPDVLFLDETFSNVDEAMEAMILEHLLTAYGGKTIVCICHRQASGRFFDRCIEVC